MILYLIIDVQRRKAVSIVSSLQNDNSINLNTPLELYLEKMIFNLPNASKLVMQTLNNNQSKNSFNKEDLSLESRVRRGDLNTALNWIEALGLVAYSPSGKQKLYALTPLGVEAFKKFKEQFHTLREEFRE